MTWCLVQLFWVSIGLAIGGCNGGGGEDGTATTSPEIAAEETVTEEVVYKAHGLDFSPYVDDQDPNLGAVVDEAQLYTRMAIIAPYTQWIRTFGVTQGLEASGRVAHGLGLKAALGAWLSDDLIANEREIANLIARGVAEEADLLIVGSEVLRRGDLTEAQLLEYIRRVEAAVPSLPVTYADVYSELLAHPAVTAAVDVVFVNYYPYWEGLSVDVGVAAIHRWHAQVVAASSGKEVIVSETGWPSEGNVQRDAIPSPENASLFFLNFVSWARTNAVQYHYFEAFDEPWKAMYEGPQGAYWGVWDQYGNLKPGMARVFAGDMIYDNWTVLAIPGGPGTPEVELTYVPPYGSSNDLQGQVWHVDPDQYAVAVYIYVSGWWTKPTFDEPVTDLRVDGSWWCDITTGGVDEQATEIAVFLLPIGYSPPLLSDSSTLPVTLYEDAAAYVTTSRSP